MLNLCITFDYELFFGKADGPPQDILITPTNRICDILSRHEVSATFFADIGMSIRHRREGLNYDADLIDGQLKALKNAGYDVQLHIHPFWYNAHYNDGEWHFNNSFYRLHDFAQESPDYKAIIDETYTYLCNLIRTVDEDYKCIAFRAGGFCIQPEKRILAELKKHGVLIDSSVCKGLRSNTSSHKYNYMKTPRSLNWNFSINSGVCVEDDDGDFIEIPIGSVYKIPSKWMIVHGNPKLEREPLRGTTSKDSDSPKPLYYRLYRKGISFLHEGVMMSLDSSHYKALEQMIGYYVNNSSIYKDEYLCLIGHPKLFGSTNYDNLDLFLKTVKSKFNENMRFCTFKEIYENVLLGGSHD